MERKNLLTRIKGGTLATIGFILSPLSWWNDLVVNFPLSYLIAFPFSLVNKSLFLPAFIGAYWATNILGLLLLHRGGKKIVKPNDPPTDFRQDLKSTLIWSTIYTLFIIALVATGVLSFPLDFLEKLSSQ